MATKTQEINRNKKRLLDVIDEGSEPLGKVAHKMVVDCGKDDSWLNDPTRNNGHSNIKSAGQIRHTLDPSALLSVMLRVMNEHPDYNAIQGINYGFVDKVRQIRNVTTHVDKTFLFDDYLVNNAIRSVREFNRIIQAAGNRIAPPAPSGPAVQQAVRQPVAPSFGPRPSFSA